MKQLNEGMRGGDLEDLVLPLISVDEFESKVDDNAIVIGFYVNDHDAANDLNRFIQKSPTPLLDTDVSPAPDQRGYYLVFVEFLNNERIGENVNDIVEEVSPLANIDSWQMRVRGVDGLVPFSMDAVTTHFGKEEEEKTDEVAESVIEFLQPTAIERVIARDGQLVLEGFGYHEEYEIVAFGPLDRIVEESELTVQALDVGFAANMAARRMDRRFGEGWTVSCISGMNLVSRADSDVALLIKNKTI
jgi:hypothetical protein